MRRFLRHRLPTRDPGPHRLVPPTRLALRHPLKRVAQPHGLVLVARDLTSRTKRKFGTSTTSSWRRGTDTTRKPMAKNWTIDGDHFEPDGTRAHGKHQVEKLFTLEQATVFKDSEIDLIIETVFFISQDVALVDGSYEVVGAKTQDGDALPARQGHLTSVLLKERGKWWVVASRATINVPLAWRGD